MIDTIYAAGFFDGEGCIHLNRNIRVIVSGCFLPGLLDLFPERWGGKIRRQNNHNPNQRSGVRWEITGRRAADCLTDLLPYLVEKREQAVLALEYQAKKYATGIRGGKGYSPSQRAEFLSIEKRIRELKVRKHVYLAGGDESYPKKNTVSIET